MSTSSCCLASLALHDYNTTCVSQKWTVQNRQHAAVSCCYL